MRKVDVTFLARVRGLIKLLVVMPQLDEAPLDSESRKSLEGIPKYLEFFTASEMPCTVAAMNRIREALSDGRQLKVGDARRLCSELDSRLLDELDGHLFLHVNVGLASYYAKDKPFGDAVYEAFPDARYDIREASTCVALSRPTACVFHLMRSLEFPIRALAIEFNIDQGNIHTRPQGNIIEEIVSKADERFKKTPKAQITPTVQMRMEFHSDMAARLGACKDAWRNAVSHSRERYDDEQAIGILRVVHDLFVKAVAGGLRYPL